MWARWYALKKDEEVVENASLKPTWLLRMFNYWGARWGQKSGKAPDKGKEKEQGAHGESNGAAQIGEAQATPDLSMENVRELHVSPDGDSSAVEVQRSPTLVRNRTT